MIAFVAATTVGYTQLGTRGNLAQQISLGISADCTPGA
jgi:hypothetical protein